MLFMKNYQDVYRNISEYNSIFRKEIIKDLSLNRSLTHKNNSISFFTLSDSVELILWEISGYYESQLKNIDVIEINDLDLSKEVIYSELTTNTLPALNLKINMDINERENFALKINNPGEFHTKCTNENIIIVMESFRGISIGDPNIHDIIVSTKDRGVNSIFYAKHLGNKMIFALVYSKSQNVLMIEVFK